MTDKNAFTLIELLVVIGILVILAAIGIAGYSSLQGKSELNSSAEEVVTILRLAQSKTLNSKKSSQYGVYFATSSKPHRYVLFKGSDYQTRASSSDMEYKLPDRVEFYGIDLGGEKQVVFERLSGSTEKGEIGLRLEEDSSQTKLIQIKKTGWVNLK